MPTQTQKALVQGPNKEAQIVTDHPIPSLPADHVLVKTTHLALNPTDWKHAKRGWAPAGTLAGCDFSGIVEAVGPAVTKKFAPGEKVMGFNHGFNGRRPNAGAFAEHVITKGDLLFRCPEGLGMDEAATLPLGLYTVAQGLYQGILQLAWPDQPTKGAEPILIYGGSSATGALAIQFAKLSGYTVLTTCSARNTDYVKSLGADAVFDYHDPACAQKIRTYTNNTLKLVYDTIALPSSTKICSDAISSSGGKYMATLYINSDRADVQSDCRLAYTIFNEPFAMGELEFEASREDFEFARRFAVVAERLVAEGKVRGHRVRRMEGGLEGILGGFELMRADKVSGEKLVYTV
ncbi:hypothetical protein FQN50_005354 [Emmonsiellopsis sp. PD_5]|nr:hypothetical protein FQN50_005354 [Emmonsiellopsis sp. PD_5]